METIQCVIGAAGHIDHGKTTLIKALTGVDLDRLEEEKRRGITIDLGFARLPLSDGRQAGVVDVPGHQGFIHNMLAGAAGIDLALLVVAADDSVMPQTLEHLAILDLLGVTRGVVALTKVDLVDAETRELALAEVRELVDRSPLKGALVIPCSPMTGEGIELLRAELERAAAAAPTRWPDAFFRLPIDRVFTVKGHGVVVTGTVFSGHVKADDRLIVSPGGMEVRVRRVQGHGATLGGAAAGMRAALNLSGVEKDQLRRGVVMCDPAIAAAVDQFTGEIACHASSPQKIVHGAAYLLHVHTAETLCRVYLSSEKSLEPGQRCVGQVRFQSPLQMLNGDRFVLRASSAKSTVGGGVILEPGGRPLGRRRMNAQAEAWLALKDVQTGLPALARRAPWGYPVEAATGMFNLTPQAFAALLRKHKNELDTFEWKGGRYLYVPREAAAIIEKVTRAVMEYHAREPASPGVEESSLARDALPGMGEQLAGYWIRRAATSGKVELKGSAVRLPGREMVFAGSDEAAREATLSVYRAAGLKSPPKTDKAHKELNMKPQEAARMIRLLTQSGDLVSLAPDYTVHRDALDEARRALVAELERAGEVETARFRDILGVGRKAAIDILEYFDRTGLTRRIENRRVLAKSAAKERAGG
ncbi:MAG: selenocysteine-specific translation elongation factor [Nitrospinae bacterium]|nr:selenocysteine-specific translation elongation factor [Nitrospinota bacterium]